MSLFASLFLRSGGNLWEKLLNWYQGSLLKELLDYASDSLFGLEFGTYEHFSLSAGAGGTVRNLIVGLAIGMVIAACMMFYTRTVHGKLIRALLKAEALSPEKAITLQQAGMFRDPSVRRELACGGALSKLIYQASAVCASADSGAPVADLAVSDDEGEATSEAANAAAGEASSAGSNADSIRVFQQYAPAKTPKNATRMHKKAATVDFTVAKFYIPEDLKYRAEMRYRREGSRLPQLLLTVVLGFISVFLLVRLLPVLLNFADWLISFFAP